MTEKELRYRKYTMEISDFRQTALCIYIGGEATLENILFRDFQVQK